jgi:hypothetical protein
MQGLSVDGSMGCPRPGASDYHNSDFAEMPCCDISRDNIVVFHVLDIER